MNLKSFIIGMLSGIALTIVGVIFLAYIGGQQETKNEAIQFLEHPVSYEDKKVTSFQVFQVIDKNTALANEISDKEYKWFNGNTVVLVGDDFYSNQVITVKRPQRVGTYSYTNNAGMPMTVPVIKGEIKEE